MSKNGSRPEGAVVIYGPEGCGKNLNAAALAAHYGKSVIIEEWDPNSDAVLPTNALVLTSSSLMPAGAIPFAQAMQEAGLVTTSEDATSTPRFCMNCIYFSHNPVLKFVECTAPGTQTISLVYGPQNNRCDWLRREGGACGPTGIHFSPIRQPGNAEAIACPASSTAEPTERTDSPAVLMASATSSKAGVNE